MIERYAPLMVLVLAALGALTALVWLVTGVWYAGRLALRRWVLPGLWRRHHRVCDPLNAAWNRKLVRHAPTGRIGMCLRVCMRGGGGSLRELTWPHWTARVIFDARLAAICQAGAEGQTTVVMIPRGCTEELPLGEMTLAPEGEAAEFRAEMERAVE